MGRKRSWKDEEIAVVTTAWTRGLSTGQIARLLVGKTRDAVAGQVCRLGLRRNQPFAPA